MTNKKQISAAFPFESKFQEVLDSKMHYVDEGDKNSEHTFLLIHGNPTSSYLWRNIIPYVSPLGRVVVPDLIGMGKSDKPDIDYTLKDHIAYLDAFVEKLGLKNVILVIQDWGSGLGFNYANQHRENVKAIVFFEAMVQVSYWKNTTKETETLFKKFRDPVEGHEMIVKNNFFIEAMLPMMAGRELTKEEMDHYRAPYLEEKSRKPLFMWPGQISFDGVPKFTTDIVNSYNEYHKNSDVPKLLFYAEPGLIINRKLGEHIAETWKNVTAVDLGEGKHYLQESHPHEIGEGIVDWYKKTLNK
ncbi:haloalkane dehalogenase [Cellulophaga sp. 20_2_10]|uniref:haloalkane dehalogenase n=1 Tax=Cellulophaga sp. 20_2_10 TaxID=2942476 RepID=UPI00201A4221|nr:haloalkane dehalogenase [Cellulophaga sp. 20_2_10]MCL5244328.1 haloalkane dehalogenase [Cellulophaga sp. 20_2_10]